MTRFSEAVEMFRKGCACSQAILAAYGPPLGLSREHAMRMAAGFAGGMRMGETCGAVTGAFMVLGLRHASGDSDTRAKRAEAYDRVVEFAGRFRKQAGSLVCRDLLGCDISTPEGMKQAHDRHLLETTCVKMVELAAQILEQMQQESRPTSAGESSTPESGGGR